MNELVHVDGAALTVRPIETTDVEELARMFGKLSRESIYFRFFSPLLQVPNVMLRTMTEVDHCRRDAVVAVDGAEIVALASYDAMPPPASREAEIAIVVEDAWQHRGVALRLMCQLAELALERDYDTFVARTLPTNRAALAFARKLAPHAIARFADGEYDVRLTIDDLACERLVGSGGRGER